MKRKVYSKVTVNYQQFEFKEFARNFTQSSLTDSSRIGCQILNLWKDESRNLFRLLTLSGEKNYDLNAETYTETSLHHAEFCLIPGDLDEAHKKTQGFHIEQEHSVNAEIPHVLRDQEERLENLVYC